MDNQTREIEDIKMIIDFLRAYGKPILIQQLAPRLPAQRSIYAVKERIKKMEEMELVETASYGIRSTWCVWLPEIIVKPSQAPEQGEDKGEPSSPDGEREESSETNSEPKE